MSICLFEFAQSIIRHPLINKPLRPQDVEVLEEKMGKN